MGDGVVGGPFDFFAAMSTLLSPFTVRFHMFIVNMRPVITNEASQTWNEVIKKT